MVFTLLLQLLKSKNSAQTFFAINNTFASSANMSKIFNFGRNGLLVKQADSFGLFPLLMKTLVSWRVYTIHKFSLLEKFANLVIYHRICQNILSRKSSHKDTPISVLFSVTYITLI